MVGWAIDRGVVNVATDSEGNIYQGQRVEARRKRYVARRRNIAKDGNKSAKRQLKQVRRASRRVFRRT